jgi:thiol peroxidase
MSSLRRFGWLTLAALVPLACASKVEPPEAAKAPERTGLVSRGTEPLVLLGPALKVGQAAPDFTAVRNDMTEAHLSDFAGKTVLVAAVPSLDTPVCNAEVQRFNEEAAKLRDTVVLAISMDLPFAQKRWCGLHDAKNIIALSDYRSADFGLKYGVLIKGLHLEARSIFIVDPKGRIAYIQIVPQLGEQPDFDAALAAARKAAGS